MIKTKTLKRKNNTKLLAHLGTVGQMRENLRRDKTSILMLRLNCKIKKKILKQWILNVLQALNGRSPKNPLIVLPIYYKHTWSTSCTCNRN